MDRHPQHPEAEKPSHRRLDTRPLLLALAGTLVFHGGLLPFTHGNTYDAFIHMFFADSYHRSWFDTWEPRWYTGFSTMSYPPGTHMAIAGLMYLVPLRAAFVLVQLIGLVLLVVGVFRFSRLWVPQRSAGYAGLCLVLSSSVVETVHLFGQLPTIFSLGLFLNGLPHVYRWITTGRWPDFWAALVFAAATTAAHHVTTIFGGVLFIIPLALHALAGLYSKAPARRLIAIAPAVWRGLFLAVGMLCMILLTVFPYWSWSINDPITQVPIPHGSRESFVERIDLGIVFFLIPWGLALFVLPYVIWKSLTTRLWPLGGAVLICFILGTGGTTPIPKAVLGGAYDILTLDRFTFWGSILILPFFGYLIDGLLHGRSRAALRRMFGQTIYRAMVGSVFMAMVAIATGVAALTSVRPTQPKFIDPAPILRFLSQDEHDRWRYLTLGFGDQFAYLSALTSALSVDGNYHSARRLPDMTRFSVERLENAKYLGVPGLGSLQQFLVNADSYHLKYVFSNDAFYDPLLHFSGWNRLNRLSNGVTIWEKPDVTPLPMVLPRRAISPVYAAMWGILPPVALLAATVVLLFSATGRNSRITTPDPQLGAGCQTGFANARPVRAMAVLMLGVTTGVILLSGIGIRHALGRPATAPETIEAYFHDLDFRRFPQAYERLDPVTRGSIDSILFNWRWRGGLIASYGKLTDTRLTHIAGNGYIDDWRVELDWLTALGKRQEVRQVRTVLRDGEWYVAPTSMRSTQTPDRLQRMADVDWNVVGRRQPRVETDFHRDRLDRPRIMVHGTRLVKREGRYHSIGAVTNTDADPAIVSLFANLKSEQKHLARQASGHHISQRLRPAETTGFRIDFEGILSLDHKRTAGEFDPALFIPPELDAPPETSELEALALVSAHELYRGVSLNGLRIAYDGNQIGLTGHAVNTGTQPATITRVVALLYDDKGLPVWTEAGFVEDNIYPGQSAAFEMTLPDRAEITIIHELSDQDMVVNGSNQKSLLNLPGHMHGTIPLAIPGYSALRLSVSSMTFDPLF